MTNNPDFARDDRSFLQREMDEYLQKIGPYTKKGLDPTEPVAENPGDWAGDRVNRPVEEGMLVLAYITTSRLSKTGYQYVVEIKVYAGDRRIRNINLTYGSHSGLREIRYNLDSVPDGETYSNEIWGIIREYEPQKTDGIEFVTWDSPFPGIEWYSAPYEMFGHIGDYLDYLDEKLTSEKEEELE